MHLNKYIYIYINKYKCVALSEMVICLTLYFFKATNELRNYSLTHTITKVFICSFEYLVCSWCCKTRGV